MKKNDVFDPNSPIKPAKGLGFATPAVEGPRNDLLEYKVHKDKPRNDVQT